MLFVAKPLIEWKPPSPQPARSTKDNSWQLFMQFLKAAFFVRRNPSISPMAAPWSLNHASLRMRFLRQQFLRAIGLNRMLGGKNSFGDASLSV